jgi:acyl transferase domain-containing protein
MSTEHTPLAIVGIGCLFPKADGPGAYWANIKNKVDGIGPVPPSHWDPADYFDADPKRPDFTYARRGGFLDPYPFPPGEFGIAPNDLEATDSSQLLGLVAAQMALRDAGLLGATARAVDKRRVSVILGVTGTLELVIPLGARLGHPLWRKALKDAGVSDAVADAVVRRIGDGYVGWQESSFPGLLGNVVAGRIANRLDLGGTNCVVDAACASSLSALHLAGMELQTGRADVVVTGGIDTFNDIFMYMCFSKTPALSPGGDAKPFDAAGDGTILGEGLGVVVLKRLADAERDGDRVYAVVKGIGTSSDGKGNAIYAPSPVGQVAALRSAYTQADVTPDTVELVEAHGTGTRVGDAAEVQAVTEVFSDAS